MLILRYVAAVLGRYTSADSRLRARRVRRSALTGRLSCLCAPGGWTALRLVASSASCLDDFYAVPMLGLHAHRDFIPTRAKGRTNVVHRHSDRWKSRGPVHADIADFPFGGPSFNKQEISRSHRKELQ